MFWAEKVKKSIENINVEIDIKNKKLDALNALDKVNCLLKVKVFTHKKRKIWQNE